MGIMTKEGERMGWEGMERGWEGGREGEGEGEGGGEEGGGGGEGEGEGEERIQGERDCACSNLIVPHTPTPSSERGSQRGRGYNMAHCCRDVIAIEGKPHLSRSVLQMRSS